MKNLITLAVGSVLSLALLGGLAQAQTTGNDPSTATAGVPGVMPERVLPNLPPDVQAMIKAMQEARKEFVKQQKEAVATLKGNGADRATIRETLRSNLDVFIERQKPGREELRTRLAELRKEFAESRLKVIDQIKDQAGTRPRKGGN